MICPRCHSATEQVDVKSVNLDRCTSCGGTWYDADELRLLKDLESHGDYRWIDFGLWRDRDKFRTDDQEELVCPRDSDVLTTVRYGDSDVRVDICVTCGGVWLDAGEYKKVLKHLEERVNEETLQDYLHDLKEEFLDIFSGPKGPRSELADFTKVLSLLQLRFAVQFPDLVAALRSAAKGTPGT